MPSILTFGDSNTHGTQPISAVETRRRYDKLTRWPGVMLRALGSEWDLAEEGLPGRTTQHCDPVMWPDMMGQIALRISLATHAPIDVLTIMLGTNDLKTRFNPSPEKIIAGLSGLLDIALNAEIQAAHHGYKILLIAPPPVKEVGILAGEFWGAEAIAPKVAPAIERLAKARGVSFFDASSVISVSPIDGVHFEADAHETLGKSVAKVVLSF